MIAYGDLGKTIDSFMGSNDVRESCSDSCFVGDVTSVYCHFRVWKIGFDHALGLFGLTQVKIKKRKRCTLVREDVSCAFAQAGCSSGAIMKMSDCSVN